LFTFKCFSKVPEKTHEQQSNFIKLQTNLLKKVKSFCVVFVAGKKKGFFLFFNFAPYALFCFVGKTSFRALFRFNLEEEKTKKFFCLFSTLLM